MLFLYPVLLQHAVWKDLVPRQICSAEEEYDILFLLQSLLKLIGEATGEHWTGWTGREEEGGWARQRKGRAQKTKPTLNSSRRHPKYKHLHWQRWEELSQNNKKKKNTDDIFIYNCCACVCVIVYLSCVLLRLSKILMTAPCFHSFGN